MPDAVDWSFLWEVLKGIAAFLGLVASAIGGWVLKKWTTDRAMLIRHDEVIEEHEKELGFLRKMRETTENGEKPIRMIAELIKSIERLDEEMADWKQYNRERDQQCRDTNEKLSDILERLATNTEAISWMRNTLTRMESK